MFNLTTNKIIGIVGGVAGVSVAGASIVYLTSDSTQPKEASSTEVKQENKVSHKLTKAGFSPFKTDGTELGNTWAGMVTQYQLIRKTETELEDIKDGESLKNKCFSVLTSESTESANYSFAKRFCVKEETITTMLKRNGYTKLNTTVDDNNRTKWQAILDLIKGNQQAKTAIGLVLSDGGNNHLNLLAEACKKFDSENSKTTQDKEFEKHYKEAMQWCSTKDALA